MTLVRDFLDLDIFLIYSSAVMGYLKEVFPPTDFHSVTPVGEFIHIIGCRSYPQERISGGNSVYSLHCESLAIEKLETGGEQPGWISNQKAINRCGDSGEGGFESRAASCGL